VKKLLSLLLVFGVICGLGLATVGCSGGAKKEEKKQEKKEEKKAP
jgi:hypothetical protein